MVSIWIVLTGLLAAQGLEARADEPATCDPVQVEPKALLGKLSDAEVACLESAFETAEGNLRGDSSKLLIANAAPAEDRQAWAALVHRHLTEVTTEDEDLLYAYIRHLVNEGQAEEAIHWTEIALNAVEDGGTTQAERERVSSLHRHRVVAAIGHFRRLEEERRESPDQISEEEVRSASERVQSFEAAWKEWAEKHKEELEAP